MANLSSLFRSLESPPSGQDRVCLLVGPERPLFLQESPKSQSAQEAAAEVLQSQTSVSSCLPVKVWKASREPGDMSVWAFLAVSVQCCGSWQPGCRAC